MIQILTGKKDFIESLRGKRASFLLCMSNTKTANIPGITQAGIPGMLHLTPTLDAEFIAIGEVRSLDNIAETPKGVPTPALITRAVHLLHPFREIELLNLGLEIAPKLEHFRVQSFGISPSESIAQGANISAEEVFEKGVQFAQELSIAGDYIILGESVPSGTTTALATALGLGYDAKGMFSSSFKNDPSSIKNTVIDQALSRMSENDDLFKILSTVGDNMLIFNAGLILGLQNRDIPIVLAGGTQMACVLLIVNRVLQMMEGELENSKIALCTTKWVAEDAHSDIKALLEMNDFPINAYYADFDFSLTSHPALKLYDEGEAKEGVGAGGALVYALLNGITKDSITRKVESFLG